MSKVTPEEVLHSVTECINTGNLDSLTMLYESDACFASQPGRFIKGRANILLGSSLKEIILKYKSFSLSPMSDLYVQTYRSHLFMDVYALYCNKGMAFDLVADDILNIKTSEEGDEGEGILYLGDSENDNPAFSKASISIGIISDKRLTAKLDCQYVIEFKKLYGFLERLIKSKFVFSGDLLIYSK
jgi:hypothetical protein